MYLLALFPGLLCFNFEIWPGVRFGTIRAMGKDRSYDLIAFPPSMAVIADQARNDGNSLK